MTAARADVRRSRWWWWEWAWLFGPAFIWLVGTVAGVSYTFGQDEAWGAVERDGSRVVGSDDCRRCHPTAYRSWFATFHRTMTQDAAQPTAVLAPFLGEQIDYLGFRATMTKTPGGTPRVTVVALDDDGRSTGRTVLAGDVIYTVGSHHYQQYVARLDAEPDSGAVWRLPVAWHMGEQRWIHMNAAFLEPEGIVGRADDYLRHLSRWNDNCIFCHNTEPRPGTTTGERFESEVGELGIACESCHGAGSLHVGRHRNPLRRMLAQTLSGAHPTAGFDGSITHPGKLDAARESEVCGRCHGQRIARDIRAVLRDGDGFVPGRRLNAISRPIFRNSEVEGLPDNPFVSRFWPDGTPRLSAYEFQGLLLSPCYDEGRGLGCNACHDMHGADPAGQVRDPDLRSGVCADCHRAENLSRTDTGMHHGGHGSSVDCLDCHMPDTTYGLLRGMISHRITIPRPERALGQNDRPDACTQCHIDRSRSWAASKLAQVGRARPATRRPSSAATRDDWAPRVVLDLWGGDPIQRALAVHALQDPRAPAPAERRLGSLVVALEDDYPAVRWMAWRALKELARRYERADLLQPLDAYDPLGDPAHRTEIVERLRLRVAPDAVARHPRRADLLLQDRADASIWIGE